MICHSTDPKNVNYGGSAPVKPGHEAECGGALYLMIQNMNAIAEGKPQPISPPLAKSAIAKLIERHLFNGGLRVVSFEGEVNVPWRDNAIKEKRS